MIGKKQERGKIQWMKISAKFFKKKAKNKIMIRNEMMS